MKKKDITELKVILLVTTQLPSERSICKGHLWMRKSLLITSSYLLCLDLQLHHNPSSVNHFPSFPWFFTLDQLLCWSHPLEFPPYTAIALLPLEVSSFSLPDDVSVCLFWVLRIHQLPRWNYQYTLSIAAKSLRYIENQKTEEAKYESNYFTSVEACVVPVCHNRDSFVAIWLTIEL